MGSLPRLNGYQQFLQRESGRLAEFDNVSLASANFACYFGKVRGNIVWNGHDSVDVRAQQISGFNLQSEDLNRNSEIHNMHVRVGNRRGLGKHRETHSANGRDIAYGAISDHTLAIECLEDGRMHLAYYGGAASGCIQILKDGNAGGWQKADFLPPIGTIDIDVTRNWRIRGAHPAGGGMTENSRRAPRHAL